MAKLVLPEISAVTEPVLPEISAVVKPVLFEISAVAKLVLPEISAVSKLVLSEISAVGIFFIIYMAKFNIMDMRELERVILDQKDIRKRVSGYDIYYFNNGNSEADFVVCKGNVATAVYQVSYDIEDSKTRKREVNGAVAAAKATRCSNVYILTDHQTETIVSDGVTINVLPVWQWIVTNEL